MQDYNQIWKSEVIIWRWCKCCLLALQSAIVCLGHSWKAMWTRLADWLVMSNSSPQREDEPPCGLHGWVVSVWVQSCAHACMGTSRKQVCFLYIRLSRRSIWYFMYLSTSKQGSGVSMRSEWHTGVPAADVTVSELRDTGAVGSGRGQGPSFRESTGPSFSVHFSLLHYVSST